MVSAGDIRWWAESECRAVIGGSLQFANWLPEATIWQRKHLGRAGGGLGQGRLQTPQTRETSKAVKQFGHACRELIRRCLVGLGQQTVHSGWHEQ